MGDHHTQPDAHQADREQASQQVNSIDVVMAASRALDPLGLGMGQGIHFGRTNFENHQLNDMIDMVETANPEHLEHAGNALWDARDAINKAAEELSGHIGRIDWHGEAATAFQTWATGLVTDAYSLALFAENVGTQITAAGTGLASVRKSMPPRDTRLIAKSVHDFPTVAQVDSNTEYQAAQKVEGHRQEAINQMNRLASYYAVSEEGLRGQEVPEFGKMPDMGVPKADPAGYAPIREPGGGDTGGASHHSAVTAAGTGSAETLDPVQKLHDVVTAPDRHIHADPSQNVGTDIDSVHTLPPETVNSTSPATPPTAPAPPGGPGGPIPTVPVPPTAGMPVGRGAGGSRGPMVTSPRMAPPVTGASRVGGPGTGRGPLGPVGRPAVPGQTGTRGPVSPVGRAPVGQAPAGKAPVGRSVVGGMPRTVGVPAERAGGAGPTGAARTSGVIGGRPTMPPVQGVNGSRMPRGTVIGGETVSPGPRAVERPGQRGVISAPEQASAAGQPSRRPVTPTGGVVGTSNGKASEARNGGRTSGENIPGRGAVGNQGSGRDDGRKTPRRQQAPETE